MLKIQPLGGLGQIGSNLTLVSDNDDTFIIDCGILFPNEDFFDINYLIPDLSSIKSSPGNIVITHGHEDHIGAIIHLVKAFPTIKIFAPKFAKELILRKFNYEKISHSITVFNDQSTLSIGKFLVHPIFVNHSIPDTFGLVIQNTAENYLSTSIFYVSDFKIDSHSPYEKEFDFERLNSLTTHHTKKILLADSTNIMSKTLNTPSEKDVLEGLQSVIDSDKSRIFITSFSSNIHRIQSVIDIAAGLNFNVVPYGRSMINYIDLALKTDHLTDDENTLKESKSVSNKTEKLIVLLSGCQGDFRGTLKRVSSGADSIFTPCENDQFIFSSKPIPGNEKKINNIINDLSGYDSKITYTTDSIIHSSGHPGKNDLLKLYKSFGATDIIPIHGETHFLKEHYHFVKDKFKQATPYHLTNHDQLIIRGDKHKLEVKKEERPPVPIIIHGKGIEIQRAAISTRRKLACNGAIFLSIKKDSLTKLKVVFYYELLGLPTEFDGFKDDLNTLIENEVSSRKIKHLDKTSEEIRVSIRRFCNTILGYKPVTIVHFI